MTFIPRPLVQLSGPTKKQIGRKLAKAIATMRKQQRALISTTTP